MPEPQQQGALPGPRGVNHWLRRLSLFVLCVLFVVGAVYPLRHVPIVRTTLLALIASLHSAYDTSQFEPDITGPKDQIPAASNASKFHSTFVLAAGREETFWPTKIGPYRIVIEHPSPDIGQGEDLKNASTSSSIRHSFLFQAENSDSSALRPFAHSAQEILRAAANEWELCDQVRRLTEHGGELPAELLMKPDDVLRAAQAGKRLTCRPFALLLVELCTLKGCTSRLLGLSSDGNAFEHAVTEAYLPEEGRWVVLDPDFNIAYRREGRWLSAAELHDAWVALKRQIEANLGTNDREKVGTWLKAHRRELPSLTQVEVVPLGDAGQTLRDSNLPSSSTGMGLDWYEQVFYPVRNDYLTSTYPFGHDVRVRQYLLNSDAALPNPPICPEAVPLSDRRAVYWPSGRTSVTISPDSAAAAQSSSLPVLVLELSTYTPNFRHFEISRDDGPPEKFTGARYAVDLGSQPQDMSITAVNHAGVHGEATTVRIVRSSPAR